jgi:hypothetical protein
MAADQDAETHEDESNSHDEPIVGAKWARSRIFWTVAIRPRPVVHLIPVSLLRLYARSNNNDMTHATKTVPQITASAIVSHMI